LNSLKSNKSSISEPNTSRNSMQITNYATIASKPAMKNGSSLEKKNNRIKKSLNEWKTVAYRKTMGSKVTSKLKAIPVVKRLHLHVTRLELNTSKPQTKT